MKYAALACIVFSIASMAVDFSPLIQEYVHESLSLQRQRQQIVSESQLFSNQVLQTAIKTERVNYDEAQSR